MCLSIAIRRLWFSGFTQAEASTTRRYGGTGLGVAISQSLVALMGSHLKLDSVLGQGSRFHFYLTLPIAPALDRETTLVKDADWRVLFIDDNADARDVLQRMGEELGWTVEVAESGAQALAHLQSKSEAGTTYQAVFVDWQMPELDGWQTCQKIRSMALTGEPPLVVMLTAYDREMLAHRSTRDQAMLDGFLVKPVTAAMLLSAVNPSSSSEDAPACAKPSAKGVDDAPLLGMRLLVVEDNLNNQQVAKELLEDAGAIVQLADNGQEAVDLLRSDGSRADAVLMDLQMPVMDGYTATRHIRQDLGLSRLPIVAMTANVMTSDREACLAAGMNDHVGKPFEVDHLVRILWRLTGRVKEAPPPVKRITLIVPEALIEQAKAQGFAAQTGMDRMLGKTAMFQRISQSFCKSAQSLPGQLRTCMNSQNLGEAIFALHTHKGLAATLGADRLAKLSADGESMLKAEQPLPPEWIDELERQITTGTAYLASLAQSLVDLDAATTLRQTP